MLRNIAYGGLALVGGAITGIAISSWATPRSPQQAGIAPEVAHVASVAQPAVTLASASSRAVKASGDCSPWEVSDVAMEAALDEMIRRGWRPPTQIEAIAPNPSVRPVDPGALVPPGGAVASPVSPEEPVQAGMPDSPRVELIQLPPDDSTAYADTLAPAPSPPEPAPPSN